MKQKVVFLTLYRKWCIFSIGKTILVKPPYRRVQKFLFSSKAVLDCTFLIYHGKPEIFNSDQGSQFTNDEFIEELQRHNIQISMDGRGRCRDNAKMERFWWALKYEDIKIKDYVSLPQLRFGVQHYVNFYNTRRIHSALQYKTPDEVYFGICNPANRGYIKTRAFTPIFL